MRGDGYCANYNYMWWSKLPAIAKYKINGIGTKGPITGKYTRNNITSLANYITCLYIYISIMIKPCVKYFKIKK